MEKCRKCYRCAEDPKALKAMGLEPQEDDFPFLESFERFLHRPAPRPNVPVVCVAFDRHVSHDGCELFRSQRRHEFDMRLNHLKIRLSWKWRTVRNFFGRFRKPREIVWEESYSGMVPTCPRCHDFVYYQDKCCFCGQRFLPGAETVGKVLDNAE